MVDFSRSLVSLKTGFLVTHFGISLIDFFHGFPWDPNPFDLKSLYKLPLFPHLWQIILTWQITLLQSDYHFHCCVSWSQLASNPCWLTAQFPQCISSVTNPDLDNSPFQYQVPTTFNLKVHGTNMWPLVRGDHRWWAPLVVWHPSHKHQVFFELYNLLVLIKFPNMEYGIRCFLKDTSYLPKVIIIKFPITLKALSINQDYNAVICNIPPWKTLDFDTRQMIKSLLKIIYQSKIKAVMVET